ncbi:MAG: beta-galactosidase, partial [Armatimonadota bacterium]
MSVQYQNKMVLLDGEKLQLMAGEVHYWRLEREFWKPILERLLEAEIHMVATYVPWRVHMPQPGEVNFGHGPNDPLNLRAFLDLAQEMGLRVFLRPGPLIVSEMRCGGLPDYLFEDESIL